MKVSTRNKIKESNFALPEQRKYPIHDAKHARLALAFVSMHGTPEEKATVRAKVHAKYPEMGKLAAIKKAINKYKLTSLPTFGGTSLSMVKSDQIKTAYP